MEIIESQNENQATSNRRWVLRILVGGAVAAVGSDLWELLRTAIESMAIRLF